MPPTGSHVRPHISEIQQSYCELGPQLITENDVPVLEKLYADTGWASGEPQAKHFYKGWIQYEMGMAKQVTAPEEAGEHFWEAEDELLAVGVASHSERERLVLAYQLTLIGLLRARTEHAERRNHNRQHTAIHEIGHQVVTAASLMKRNTVRPSYFNRVACLAGEISVAGVLLTLDDRQFTYIPAPASPRQKYLTEQTQSGFSILIQRYHLDGLQPTRLIPLSIVKSMQPTPEPISMDPAITVFGASKSLPAVTPGEFDRLGHGLFKFGRKPSVSVSLGIAQGNLAQALRQ